MERIKVFKRVDAVLQLGHCFRVQTLHTVNLTVQELFKANQEFPYLISRDIFALDLVLQGAIFPFQSVVLVFHLLQLVQRELTCQSESEDLLFPSSAEIVLATAPVDVVFDFLQTKI